MPIWGRRESYSVVTSTVVLLVIAGVSANYLRGLIAPIEPNGLVAFEEAFMKRASTQRVRWLTVDDEPFKRAINEGKSVMVFAGSFSSSSARRFDDEVFSMRDVAARLNKEYVCVRVDVSTNPEWTTGLLPITRGLSGAEEGFAIWFFRPDGTLLTWIGRRTWNSKADGNGFLGRVNQVTDSWRGGAGDEWQRPQRDQGQERSLLRSGDTTAIPDFSLATVPVRPLFVWSASDYENQINGGNSEEAMESLRKNIASPRFDLVDGGFFRLSDGEDPMLVEFDKDAATNAEMAALCAKAWVATNDEIFLYAYKRTMECIERQFMQPGKWSSSVSCDVDRGGRSLRHSFGPAKVRVTFSKQIKDIVSLVGMNDKANPLAVPFIADRRAFFERRELIDTFVREAQMIGDMSAVHLADDSLLDASATVVARCIEASLLLDDETSLQRALGWSKGLRRFRVGDDDVVHSTKGKGQSVKWLGDYVSYADAKLWEYCATSNIGSLRDGHIVLLRALELFSRNDRTDIVGCTSTNDRVGPVDLAMPPVTDASPTVPGLIRVAFLYSVALGDTALKEFATQLVERYSCAANQYPSQFGSFFSSAHLVTESKFGCSASDISPYSLGVELRVDPFVPVVRAASEYGG